MFRRECRLPGRSHDLAVDMWAVGRVATQLLAGDTVVFDGEKPGVLPDLDTLLHDVDACRNEHSVAPMTPNGADFIRSCLEMDAGRRLTAEQARRHPWLNETRSGRGIFEERETESAQAWRPRPVVLPAIVPLPDSNEPGGEKDGCADTSYSETSGSSHMADHEDNTSPVLDARQKQPPQRPRCPDAMASRAHKNSRAKRAPRGPEQEVAGPSNA